MRILFQILPPIGASTFRGVTAFIDPSGGGTPTQEQSTRAKIRSVPSPNEIMSCLEAFYAHHLHLRVPSDFVVPSNESSDSSRWPASMQGAPLGRMVMYMRRHHRAYASSFSLPPSSSPSSPPSSTNPINEGEREKYQWAASWRPVVHALKSIHDSLTQKKRSRAKG